MRKRSMGILLGVMLALLVGQRSASAALVCNCGELERNSTKDLHFCHFGQCGADCTASPTPGENTDSCQLQRGSGVFVTVQERWSVMQGADCVPPGCITLFRYRTAIDDNDSGPWIQCQDNL